MRWNKPATLALGCFLIGAGAGSANAAVSAQDGFNPDGSSKFNFSFAPYLWLPGTSGEIVLGNGASVDIGNGVPSVSSLTSKLQAAFVAASVARYGRWSAVLDVDYVSVSLNRGLPAAAAGVTRNLDLDVSVARISPGVGYQLYNGSMGKAPATLDGRVGFTWFQTSESLDLNQTGPAGNTRVSNLSTSTGFVQPWVGLEGAVYPSENWRLALGGMVQGFGVSGGSWGWGGSAMATWAANNWLNLSFGYRAINTERERPIAAVIRSVPNLTAYGPVAAIGFTF